VTASPGGSAIAGSANAERIGAFIDAIAAIGPDRGGGWTRLAFSAEERAAHAVFAEHTAKLGLELEVDAVGNSFAWSGDADDLTLIGSHLDSVPQGGRFDGVAGVAVALEVITLLRDRCGVTAGGGVVAFAAEEGARFGIPCIGSRVAVGALPGRELADVTDREGISAAQCAGAVGLDPGVAVPWLVDHRPRAFFEVHIEQGIVLERRGRPLGLVDAIAGSTRLLLRFEGRADHSGATPMMLRRDALVAAAELVVEADRAARKHPTSVATVGWLDLHPGSITTVPGVAELALDVRDIDSERQRELAELLLDDAIRIARRHDLELTASLLSDESPALLHSSLRRRVADAVAAVGAPFAVLSSGAMHDAAFVAQVAPTALLFVPSQEGVSHAPAESSAIEHLALAAEVVATTIVDGDLMPEANRRP
jgi:hydantoinase/carbamoylase family amidase